MGGDQPSHTTQTTRVELPKWVEQASEENYNFAKQITGQPYKPYTGQTVAGTSQTTQDAYDFFRDTMGQGNPDRQRASELANKASGGIMGLDRAAYTNPFTQEVEANALRNLDRQREISLMGNSDKARAASAFGGSRHGVVDAITNAEATRSAGDLSAELRKMGFDTASGLMQQDVGNMFTGANALLGGAESGDKKRLADFSALLGIGGQEQAQTQRGLDDKYRRFLEKEGHSLEDLNVRLSALGMSPYGKSETTKSTGTPASSGTDFAQMGLGILSLLPALAGLSDERLKTDKKQVGEVAGVPMFTYRWKGQAKGTPKVYGPMAQDVEKAFPGSTHEVAGLRVVDNKVLGALADA